MANTETAKSNSPIPNDVDPAETAEWLESLDYVLERKGPERVQQLLAALEEAAIRNGVELPFTATTPYINTIPRRQAAALSRATASWSGGSRASSAGTRWRWSSGPTATSPASAGTSRTFASSATLYEVGFNHFFRGRGEERLRRRPDLFPGPRVARHVRPGVSRRPAHRAEPRSTSAASCSPAAGCRRYPHPWLMPEFWEFPTVSMGLGPIMAIYQARFNRYLTDRGINDTVAASTSGRSWATANATSRSRSARSRSPRASSSTT